MGRWGSDGQYVDHRIEGEVTLTGSNVSLISNTHDQSAPVGPGLSETINIFASAKSIAEIIQLGIRVPIPAGATTGTHRVIIGYNSPGAIVADRAIDYVYSYNSEININNLLYLNANPTTIAPTADASAIATRGSNLSISDVVGLTIVYLNLTDVAQNNVRRIRTIRKETAVL